MHLQLKIMINANFLMLDVTLRSPLMEWKSIQLHLIMSMIARNKV